MISLFRFPHRNTEFANEPLEESINSTLTITRKSVERGSWADIANIIENGETYKMLSVGDSISCKLKDGSNASIDVLDINPYGVDEVVFGFHDSLGDTEMDQRKTNAGGFPSTKMLKHLDTDIVKLLPDDLLEVITPRHIVQKFGGGKFECDARLWLPSLYEVFGEEYSRYCCDENERHFEFFKNPKNRIKLKHDREYSIDWWLRSPCVGTTTVFWVVAEAGYCVSIYSASASLGVCPCFIIRKSEAGLRARH